MRRNSRARSFRASGMSPRFSLRALTAPRSGSITPGASGANTSTVRAEVDREWAKKSANSGANSNDVTSDGVEMQPVGASGGGGGAGGTVLPVLSLSFGVDLPVGGSGRPGGSQISQTREEIEMLYKVSGCVNRNQDLN